MESKEETPDSNTADVSSTEHSATGPDGQILESAYIKREGSERRFDEETDQVAIAGVDDSKHKRVLSVINIVPTDPKGNVLSRKQITEIATKHLIKHCEEIGWWPSGEFPDIVVNRREDGTWHGVAYLKQSTLHKIKDWSDFPRVGVDSQTDDDIHRSSIL